MSSLDSQFPDSTDDGRLDSSPDMGPEGPFVPINLPSGPFLLQDDNGDVDGPFDPKAFVPTDDDPNVIYEQTDGRPLILRGIAQHDNELWTVDGGGQVWHYTILTGNEQPTEEPAVP